MSKALVITDPAVPAGKIVALVRPVFHTVDVLVVCDEERAVLAEPAADSTRAISGDGLAMGEALASVVTKVAEESEYDLIALPATARFREVAALLVGGLGAAGATDVVAIRRDESGLAIDRLLFGGVVVATVALRRPRAVITASPGSEAASGEAVAPEPTSVPTADGKRLLSRIPVERAAHLPSARRIVSIGRGVRSKDDIALIQDLCAALSADLACSRPIVEDLKWLDLPHQVGLTGTTVRPELYLAIGISGQIQHLVGMRDSKLIIAINNNPAAPIFEASDVAVVADLYEIVPRLTSLLTAGR